MPIEGPRCYVDANAFIYYGETHPTFGPPANRLMQMAASRRFTIVTSELTMAELLVLPLKVGPPELVEYYKQFLLQKSYIDLIPISQNILIDAARLRATTRCKMPDAIHVATAQAGSCTTFVSQDDKMPVPSTIKYVLLSDIVAPGDAV